MIHTILFDLDDTLYPRSAGIMGEIRSLILDFIRTRLDLPAEEADALRELYLQTYGTTMRGLQVNHQIDPEEYLLHVHDITLHEYLQPNPELDAVLDAAPQDMVIFTNASREHAERVWMSWASASTFPESWTCATWSMKASHSPPPTFASASSWGSGQKGACWWRTMSETCAPPKRLG